MKKGLIGAWLLSYSLFFITTTAFGVDFYRPGGGDESSCEAQKEVVYLGSKSYVFFRNSSGKWVSGHRGERIGVVRLDTDEKTGHLKYDKDHNTSLIDVIDPKMDQDPINKDREINGTRLAACVYRDYAYVFYDNIPDSCREKRNIHYRSKKVGSIGNKKEKESGERWSNQGTVKEGILTGFGLHSSDLLMTASVVNDRIFLFYVCSKNPKDHGCLMYDGDNWGELNVKESMLKNFPWRVDSISSQVVNIKDEHSNSETSEIAFTAKGGDHIFVYRFDGKWKENKNYTTEPVDMPFLTACKIDKNIKYPVKTLFAHIEGGSTARNVLQIFVTPSIRYECDLDQKSMSRIDDKRGKMEGHLLSFFPALSSTTDSKGNLRQYVTLVQYSEIMHTPGDVGSSNVWDILTDITASSIAPGSQYDLDDRSIMYESDYFEYKDGHDYDTGGSVADGILMRASPSAWTLIGVIEGVPPFYANDGNIDSNTSWIKYSHNSSKSVSNTITYGANVSMGLSLSPNTLPAMGYPGANSDSISISMTEGFRRIHDWSTSITKTVNINFFTSPSKNTGEYGWLIVSQPKLRFSRYDHKLDGKKMGETTLTCVVENNIAAEKYNLKEPWEGMTPRPPSFAPYLWMDINHNLYKKYSSLEEQSQNTIMSDIDGAEIVSGVSKGMRESILSQKNKHSAVNISAAIFNTSSDVSLNLDYSTSTSLSTDLLTGIKLSHPKPGQKLFCSKIVVQPLWYEGKKNGPKPPWVPTIYTGASPWCLTWKVVTFEVSEEYFNLLVKNGYLHASWIKKDN